MSEGETEDFLSRWSRRKRAAEAGLPVPEVTAPPAEQPFPVRTEATPPDVPVPVADALPKAAEAPEFDPASLPRVEDLTSASDFTAFLRHNVPDALKRAALRRAWTLDPAIRDFVGLADYDWDFNAPDGLTGFSLELGGDVKRLLAQAVGIERDEEAAALAQARRDAPGEPEVPAEGTEKAPPAEPSPGAGDAETVVAEAAPGEAATEASARLPRHGSALPG